MEREILTMKEKNLSLDNKIKGTIHRLNPIERLDLNKFEGEVKNIVTPFKGRFSADSGISRDNILAIHLAFESLKSESQIIFENKDFSERR